MLQKAEFAKFETYHANRVSGNPQTPRNPWGPPTHGYSVQLYVPVKNGTSCQHPSLGGKKNHLHVSANKNPAKLSRVLLCTDNTKLIMCSLDVERNDVESLCLDCVKILKRSTE